MKKKQKNQKAPRVWHEPRDTPLSVAAYATQYAEVWTSNQLL